MTKEACDVARAFVAGKRCSRKRTRTDGSSVVLFRSTIARKYDEHIELTPAGWPTITTHDRLNAICAHLFGARPFNCYKHQPRFGSLPISPSEVIQVPIDNPYRGDDAVDYIIGHNCMLQQIAA